MFSGSDAAFCLQRRLLQLASQLGGVTLAAVPDVLAAHRLLVVLDDLRCDVPFEFREGSRSSLLLTTHSSDVAAGSIMTLNLPRQSSRSADLNARRLWHAISVCSPHGVIRNCQRDSRKQNELLNSSSVPGSPIGSILFVSG